KGVTSSSTRRGPRRAGAAGGPAAATATEPRSSPSHLPSRPSRVSWRLRASGSERQGGLPLMVSRNLLRTYDLPDGQLERELEAAFGGGDGDWLPPDSQDFQENKLLTGRVRGVTSEAVLVDIGYKSEGTIELREWYDEGVGQV